MTIFKQIYELEHGLKDRTRRAAGPNDTHTLDDQGRITAVLTNGRVKYRVGQDYSICPKRGQFSVGRYRLLGISYEPLLGITETEAIREGLYWEPSEAAYITSVLPRLRFLNPVVGYLYLWDSINGKTIYRRANNPYVYGYTIQVLHINGKAVAA